ncbi:MAG: YeeE/YedE thiosulfate transporter family protein [Bacteroidota bacterium]
MNAPFFKTGLFGHDASLLVAFAIGIAFGFFLERGGLGSSRKLAAQFYFTDLTVFKVMFTAIITAMLGLYWLSWFGVLDLSLVHVGPTYVLPQLLGGLIFGIGFVTGGYCPGTSCVAAATGKIDGLVTLSGILVGIVFAAELFDPLSGFLFSTSLGKLTIPEVLSLSSGMVVLVVVLIALGGFVGAEAVERRYSRR